MGFIPFQLVLEGPLRVPVWIRSHRPAPQAGLARLPLLRLGLWLGAVLLVSGGKAYYIAGAYPLLLGFGALPVDAWLTRGGRTRSFAWLAAAVW